MADQNEPPTGPDLRAGIASNDLAEGAILAGQVGDDAVVLARVGGRCFAIGAKCSHYSGPLAEGILVGETIRCPWHHAAFSLRTGESDRPPAIDALPCWTVEETGGRIRVRDRVESSKPARSAPRHADAPESIVIVGGGAAGTIAADTLRREGYDGAITIIEADADEPVDRPNLSKDFLAGNAPEEWMPLRPASSRCSPSAPSKTAAPSFMRPTRPGRARRSS